MDAAARRAAFTDELTKVSRKLRTQVDARVRQDGLTLSRARVLLMLARQDGMTQSQLAEALEVEQPSMVSLIDGLEKVGLVRRCEVEGDRRVKSIHLTEQAHTQTGSLLAYIESLRVQILKDVDEADLDTAIRVLKRVSGNIVTLV